MVKVKQFFLGLIKFIGKFLAFIFSFAYGAILSLYTLMTIIPKVANKEIFESFLESAIQNEFFIQILNFVYLNDKLLLYLIFWSVGSIILITFFTWKVRKSLYFNSFPLLIIGGMYLSINSFYAFIANKITTDQLVVLEEKWDIISSNMINIGKYYFGAGIIMFFIAFTMSLNSKKKSSDDIVKKANIENQQHEVIKEETSQTNEPQPSEKPIINEVNNEQHINKEEIPNQAIDIPIDLPKVEIKEYCSQCGTLVEEDQIYCSKCGNITKKL